MADNGQLDFRLKIYVLELSSQISTTMTSPSPSPQLPTSAMAAAGTNSTLPAAADVTDYVIQRTIDTFEISRNDIEYRAEGNANIVLSIPKRCQVLRLPKKSKRLFDSFHLGDSCSKSRATRRGSFVFANLCHSECLFVLCASLSPSLSLHFRFV